MTAPSLPVVGTQFAERFYIERLAGQGGMGAVFQARDRKSGSPVALKVLHADAADPLEAKRFTAEAQTLAALHHPGIVRYISHGVSPAGQQFLAMEWLEGEDLNKRLARGPLSVRDSLRLIQYVASALAVAHQQGIVHRDLKPSNLFLIGGDLEQVKLIDFGIARRQDAGQALTQTGALIGTPAYMAPEQVRGLRELTPAADVFALGSILYECLAGVLPFRSEHIPAVLVRILLEEPHPLSDYRPGVPAAVHALLSRMLAKDVSRRYASGGVLAAAVSGLGEVGELREVKAPEPLAAVAATANLTASFAASEQALFTLIIAKVPAEIAAYDATEQDATARAEKVNGPALLASLRGLGVSPHYLVDGSLVVTVPQTGNVTDQVGLAARTALHIKEHWSSARVAVATGRGIADGVGAVGEVAERAIRLLQHADPKGAAATIKTASGIRMDELSERLLGTRFTVLHTDEGTQLIGESKEVDASRPLLGKPTPCVGRDTELATLEALLGGCIENAEAQAVLITASPGIGKSRLRHEFLRRVAKRDEAVTVLQGCGDLVSAGTAYSILGRAIRRASGISDSEPISEQRRRLQVHLGRSIAPAELERVATFFNELCGIPAADENAPMLRAARKDPMVMVSRIRRAFLDWLGAECQAAPVVLVLDDLQWGDSLTLALLEQAWRELEGARLFVLGLARPEVHEVFPKLRQSQKLQEIPLKGLSKKACERLIQQVLGQSVSAADVARAVEQAAGNALFLEELIRSLAEGGSMAHHAVPETVVAMLQARIGRFEPGPRRAVRAAAVFGQTFWRGGVAAILDLAATPSMVEPWLGALVDAEVIERHPESRVAEEQEYGFRHALVRDAAYALLTESDLTTGHGLAGNFLEAAGERDAVVVAQHFQRSGQLERAAPLYQRAGDDSARLGLYSAARDHYVAALGLLAQLPPAPEVRYHQVDTLLRQVRVSLVSDHTQQNLQRLATAEELISANLAATHKAPNPADQRLLARTQYLMGRVHYYAAQYPDAIRRYQQVLELAHGLDDPELVALPAAVIGMAVAAQGNMAKAKGLLTRALDPLAQTGDDFELVRSQLYMGFISAAMGDYRNGTAHIDAWLIRAQQMENRLLTVMGRLLRLMSHRAAMDWPRLLEDVADLGALTFQLGEKVYAILAWNLEAWAHAQLGHDDKAAALRQRAVAVTNEIGGRCITSDWYVAADAEMALLRGELELALTTAQAVVAAASKADLFLSWATAERVWAAVLSRRGAAAAEVEQHLRESLRVFTLGGLLLDAAQTELWWARLLKERGCPWEEAQPHLHKATQIFAAAGCEYAVAHAEDGSRR